MRTRPTGVIAGLLAAGGLTLGGPAARADTDDFMGGFLVVSGVAMLGLGTAGLVDIYSGPAPQTDDERQLRREAEPFMWMGVTSGLVAIGFGAFVLSADEALSEPACDEGPCEADDPQAAPVAAAPTLTWAPMAGPSWGAAAVLRW